MKRPLGTSHAVLQDGPKTRRYVRWFGVNDLHSHFRWHAIERYVDFDADRTLEVGSHSGVMTFELAPRMRGEIVSSEFDEIMLGQAQKIHAGGGYENVTLGQADLRTLAADPGTFDQALVIDVLEHIDDHETAVRQLAAALRTGGRLVVSVPTPNYPEVFGRPFHERIGHVREGYWLDDLKALLEPAGFSVVESHYYTGPLASWGCGLYYRRGISDRVGLLAMPPLRRLGMLGERRVRTEKAASIALVAVKTT